MRLIEHNFHSLNCLEYVLSLYDKNAVLISTEILILVNLYFEENFEKLNPKKGYKCRMSPNESYGSGITGSVSPFYIFYGIRLGLCAVDLEYRDSLFDMLYRYFDKVKSAANV